MISRGKLYKYSTRSLEFKEEIVPFHRKLLKSLRFLGLTSIMAGVITFLFSFLIGPPIEVALSLKERAIKSEYLKINSELDSMQVALHKKIFVTDKRYREILELDSLPIPIRFAGFGGSNPYDTIQTYQSKELISNTLKKVDLLKSQLKIQVESSSLVQKEASKYNAELSFIPAIKPVKPAKNIWTSSSYGMRTDPFTRRRTYHKGIDFSGPKNTKIFATANGIVTNTKRSRRGYGKEVVISHKFGYCTRYAHLNEISVSEGDSIVRGQLIGLMGNTGRSTGTHLHYEVKLNRRPINPKYYFTEDLTEDEYELLTKLHHTDE